MGGLQLYGVELGVDGAGRGWTALIEVKMCGFQLAGIDGRQLGDGTAERSDVRAWFDAGKREVGRVWTPLALNAKRCECLLRGCGQGGQGRGGLNGHPENARGVRVGKPAETLGRKGDRAGAVYSVERQLQFLQALFRPFPDKLGGDV